MPAVSRTEKALAVAGGVAGGLVAFYLLCLVAPGPDPGRTYDDPGPIDFDPFDPDLY